MKNVVSHPVDDAELLEDIVKIIALLLGGPQSSSELFYER